MPRPVLVVEDDRKIGRVVALYLEQAGYRVVQAATGQAAVEAADRELPLPAVLDLMLPDLGGEQVIQELQALVDLLVLILTSRSSEEDRVVGFAPPLQSRLHWRLHVDPLTQERTPPST